VIVVELLGRLAPLLLLRADLGASEALLVAAVAVLAVAVLVVVVSSVRRSDGALAIERDGFVERRPLLRATEPSAAGHSRARAPGATR
jgi:hypothetical protein